MRLLSKSKLLAFRQCPKRLWLEIHKPELREDSAGTQASFAVGHEVGDIARQIYDPKNTGELIDPFKDGFDFAFSRTQELLTVSKPIFEAGFKAEGALALADVLLPLDSSTNPDWRMVEVKSSTSVKDYHRDDLAIQACIAKNAGVPLKSMSLAHINNQWVYPGDENYQGLLIEEDLTEEAFSRELEVKDWIAQAKSISKEKLEPIIKTGDQCTHPYECGFLTYCSSQEPQVEYPVNWLPGPQSKGLKAKVATQESPIDLRDVPNELMNEIQLRVKDSTVSGKVYFDAQGAKEDLQTYPLPAYFLDFETIQFAVPIWKGTSPYRIIPFQFSVHRISQQGKLEHQEYLDLSGEDPSLPFAKALITECGVQGPVFVYNAAFEKTRIKDLAERFPQLSTALLSINERVVDLYPIAKNRYYHPNQKGSWSIKAVLPAVIPELRYGDLEGVQDGGMAMEAYLEAIASQTTPARKEEIQKQLLKYCELDTYAMVKLWQYFSDRSDLIL